MTHQYSIWCEVSGGVTGYRAAWLKSKGKLKLFATREAAEHEAVRLNMKTNASPYAKASFRYTVRQWQ